MPTILSSKSIYYNDCNLIAQHGLINSRAEVPKETFRFIVSPMSAVVGRAFAIEAAKNGLTVCLHRFCSPEKELSIYQSIPMEYRQNVYCSTGMKDANKRLSLFNEALCFNFVLDVANGYMPILPSFIHNLARSHKINRIIVGNTHTKSGFQFLKKAIIDNKIGQGIIRVGLSGGSACSTSDSTGINRGQITEITECYELEWLSDGVSICADGGIKNSGYACKAFAAGAKYCMMGQFWTQAKEAETNITGDGSYYGGASVKQQILAYGQKIRHSEGKELKKKSLNLKPLKEIINDLWMAVASYVSYSGYKSLSEAIGNGVFEIKENSLPPKERE